MAPSADSRQRNYAARISNQEWEKWKDEIRTEFLGDKTVKEIVETLSTRGLNVTKSQLEHKAKQWRLHRKLGSETWRYVDYLVRKRKAAGKDSLVILSGKRLCSKKVEYETARHQRPSLLRQTTPDPPGSETDLFVCTPRASSPSPAAFMLPRSLPWYKFLHTVSLKLLPTRHAPLTRNKNATAFQTFGLEARTASLLTRCYQQGFADIKSPEIGQSLFNQFIRRTVQFLTRSEDPAKLQIASPSIDWVAAQFASFLPKCFVEEKIQRVGSLIEDKHRDQQKGLLHMLVYLASNHLVLDEGNYLEHNLRTAEVFVLLFRLTNLTSPSMLHDLIQFSRESPTLAAVVEELFQAAMMIDAPDIVANILENNPRLINLGVRTLNKWPKEVLPPLHYAVFYGSGDLVKLLLKYQADINEVTSQDENDQGWTPLALAACRSSVQMSTEMVHLLLQNHAAPNLGEGYSPLSLCLSRGNYPLALQLIETGTIDSRCDSGHLILNGEGVCALLEQRARLLDRLSIFGFAVCVSASPSTAHVDDDPGELRNYANELVVLILLEALQTRTKSHCGSDAMILAASRGYIKAMSYLRTKLGQSVDSTNGAMSPFYAAVLWNQTDAARQLLEWGASASMDERLREPWIHSQHGLPTPLHIGIQFGSSNMVRLLIHHGGEVNQPSKFYREIYSRQWEPFRWRPEVYSPWELYLEDRTSTYSTVPPLLFAVLRRRWTDAETLLAMGAESSGDILFEAAKQGQLDLVARLIAKGTRPDDSSRWGLSALEAAAAQGHDPVVSYLLRAGATVFDTNFAALFGLSNVSTIRTLLQMHSKRPKLRDDRTGRSYLETAILHGHKDVVDLALRVDPDYYDSGALCAATERDSMFHSPDTHFLLHELVMRRERSSCIESHIVLSLESTAISIAAFHNRLDTIELPTKSSKYDLSKALGMRVEDWNFYHARNKGICDEWRFPEEEDVSPLENAAIGKREEVSLRLLQEGYRPDVRSILAAMSHLKDNVVEKFIEQCENVNVAVRSWTPLQEAVRRRNIKLVKTLLAKSAEVNMYERRYDDFPTDWGYPSLTIAAKAGDSGMVSLLLDKGADVNKGHSSSAECTALQLAVAKGYISIVKCLITHNADMHARRYPVAGLGESGHGTPLEEASRWGRLDIVHLLLDSGLSTLGYHRVQYVLSIICAQKSGHHTVVRALYNHRPWSPEDEEIYQELTEFPPDRTIFFHPKEYPEAEFLGTIEETLHQLGLRYTEWRWWKDITLVHEFAMAEGISDIEFGGATDEFETDEGESIGWSIDDHDSNEEESIEDSADGSESNQEEAVERTDEDYPAGPPGIEGKTSQNDSIITTFSGGGRLGRHSQSSFFPQMGASMQVDESCISWPYDSSFERPEGSETNIPMEPGSQTSQHSFERYNCSVLCPVGQMVDASEPSLWLCNDVSGWPGDNDMNMNISTGMGNWNLDTTSGGWQQDINSSMELEDMFDFSEWFQ